MNIQAPDAFAQTPNPAMPIHDASILTLGGTQAQITLNLHLTDYPLG